MSSAAARVEGYEVPIHPALRVPLLLGGVPRGVAIALGTLSGAIGLGLQQWLAGIALWFVAHSLAVLATRHDPQMIFVALRHLRQPGYLAC